MGRSGSADSRPGHLRCWVNRVSGELWRASRAGLCAPTQQDGRHGVGDLTECPLPHVLERQQQSECIALLPDPKERLMGIARTLPVFTIDFGP